MYCKRCGAMIDGGSFCNRCGAGTGDTNNTRNVYYTEKNAGLSLVLSIVWTGLGHLYMGQVKKGISIMAAGFAAVVAAMLVIVFTGSIFSYLIMIVPFLIYVWSIFDAYGLVKRYNANLRDTGKPLW